jgi:hypothetical protein
MGYRAAAKHRKGQPSRIAETICGAVDVRKTSARFFIVMEQVKCAKDLADLIQEPCYWKALRHKGLDTGAKLARNFIEVERGPERNVFAYVMSRERKLIVAIEVVRALLELSRAGMVHLDWKPANVLVTTKSADLRKSKPSEPLLKLIDFGEAAVATKGDGKLDYTTGTQGYAAPEMEYGAHRPVRRSTPRGAESRVRRYGMAPLAADVFSVGVTLLELWVGCLWHGAKTEAGCVKERLEALKRVHAQTHSQTHAHARAHICCMQRDTTGEHDRRFNRQAADRMPQPRSGSTANRATVARAAEEGAKAKGRVLSLSGMQQGYASCNVTSGMQHATLMNPQLTRRWHATSRVLELRDWPMGRGSKSRTW